MNIEFNTKIPFPERRRSRLSRGVAIVPSLLTACAMFLGFYSIIYTLNEVISGGSQFQPAVFAIVAATLFDSLDGRVARFMKLESAFGEHFDSIADMVSFGVAPAVLVYSSALQKLGRLGWLASFMYLSCVAIRLARFNVLANQQPAHKKYFKGLSSPVSAGGLSVMMLLAHQVLEGIWFQSFVLAATVAVSLLMVSNVRFRSFKDIDFKRYPFQYFMGACALIAFVAVYLEIALFVIFIVYLLSGLIEEIILFRRRRKSDPSVPFLPFGDRPGGSEN